MPTRSSSAILFLVLVTGTVSLANAQQPPLRQGQSPGPRFVMSALKGEGDGPRLGFQVANAVRERIASDFDMRALWVVPESTITAYLISAGYPADQPLSKEETRQLASSFRAEEVLAGVVSKTPTGGYRVQASWGLTGRDDMMQPLPAVEASKISDVAKLVAREFQLARKQVESVQRCMSLARSRNYTAALVEARKAIDAYPRSVLGRICIANIYDQEKLDPDSVLRISEEILGIHAENARALAFAADAYGAKKMVDDQIRMLDRLVQVEPLNRRARTVLTNLRASRGELDRAKALVDTLVAQEPDSAALALQWRVYRAAKEWARVVEIGERRLDVDSSAGTPDFFVSMIAAADAADDAPKALDLATRAVGRFPNNDTLVVIRVQYLRRNGQLRQALAVVNALLARNPRAPNAWTQKARIEFELALGADTVLASLGSGLTNGEDRATVAALARALGQTVAGDSTSPNKLIPLRTGIRYFKLADSAQPGDTTSFWLGRTSVVLASRLANEPAAAKTCELAKELQNALVDAQIHLPRAGRSFPVQVPPLMGAVAKLSPYSDDLTKAVCRKGGED
jgi:tetratricopeptide (TPR) repeat protein